jgi:hypothetical protein
MTVPDGDVPDDDMPDDDMPDDELSRVDRFGWVLRGLPADHPVPAIGLVAGQE